MKKRFLALLLAGMMVLTMAPAALADGVNGTFEGTAEIGDCQRRFLGRPIHAAEMSFHLIGGNRGSHLILSFGVR